MPASDSDTRFIGTGSATPDGIPATSMMAGRRARPRIVAPVLAFIWPGLGQLWLGERRLAIVMAVPPLLGMLGLAAWLLTSPVSFIAQLLAPSFAGALIVLIVIDMVWRILSVTDAWLRTRNTTVLRGDRVAPVVLAMSVLLIAVHAFAGVWVAGVNSAAQPIFGPGRAAGPVSVPVVSPGSSPGVTPGSSPTPTGTPDLSDMLDDLTGPPGDWCPTDNDLPCVDADHPIPAEGPLNILFIGVDWTPGRDHGLTDTLMVLSFDPQTGKSSQISIPRDTGRLAMFDGTTYDNRINSLMGYFRSHPDQYPDQPLATLAHEIGYLLGIRIHYYALLNMPGFSGLVDSIGGVDVYVPYDIADPMHNFYLSKGPHHLDGATALLYARSRYGPNNNDWQRARRQQDLLRAIADRMRKPSVAARLPDIISQAAKVARTNVPVNDLSAFLQLLDQTRNADPVKVVLQPGKYASRIPPGEVHGKYMTQLKMDAVRQLSLDLFGQYSRYYWTSP